MRFSEPPVNAEPHYLARLDHDAEEITLVVDIGPTKDPALNRHYRVTAKSVAREEGSPFGLDSIKKASAPKLPREEGFDHLFRRHVAIFDPQYGTPEDAFEVFRAWAFCQIARELLPVRPIAIFTGGPGSTKSTTCQAIPQLWYGLDASCASPRRIADSLREFLGTSRENPFILIDNYETPQAWLPDTLCLVSSYGTALETRQLYTTSTMQSIKPDTFVAITTFSAQGVIRGDLLARSLIFDLKAPDEGYMAQSQWQHEVAHARTGFWREALQLVPYILNALHDRHSHARTFDRLKDFMWIGETICRFFKGELGVRRFQRGMAAIALARINLATSDPEIDPLITVAGLEKSKDTWYTTKELLDAVGEATGVGHRFESTSKATAAFGKWVSSVSAKAQGILKVDRRRLNGYTRLRLELPDWVTTAQEILRTPAEAVESAVLAEVVTATTQGAEALVLAEPSDETSTTDESHIMEIMIGVKLDKSADRNATTENDTYSELVL